uniref:Uncharacterized protein n=1 Tax=Anguilla anguilla TaxID=7936 RepID=A0A0E9R5L6_ANGAN
MVVTDVLKIQHRCRSYFLLKCYCYAC